MEADAKVRVFGDIECVPTSNCLENGSLEIHRGSAQRDGRPLRRQRRQQHREPACVFDREPPRDQVLPSVVIGQLGLEANDRTIDPIKSCDRAPDLQRVGPVLNVEDGHQLLGPGQSERDL